MKKILCIIICISTIFSLTGCNEKQDKTNTEKFMIGNTLNEGRIIHFTFFVPYKNNSLSLSLSQNEISIEDFINKLDYIDTLRDGGSKIYKYNKKKELFGKEDFYVIVCDSLDNIKDIYVAKHKENLNDKCSIKINDLKEVSMTIKDGTLTKYGVTIIITDLSGKDNIYGQEYRIDKKENDRWEELDTIIDNYAWNSIGYNVDNKGKLEFDINWEWLYGRLKPGEYRLVKSTGEPGEEPQHYITVEFIIE